MKACALLSFAAACPAAAHPRLFGAPPDARAAGGPVLPAYDRPQNPGLGRNPFSSQHGDAYLSDTSNVPAPADASVTVEHEVTTGGFCYTAAFTSGDDRAVLICHGLDLKTSLVLLNRSTDRACWADPGCEVLGLLDKFQLDGKGRDAGIYFYIDNQDQAVVANKQKLQWFNVTGDDLKVLREVDLGGYLVNESDFVTSAFPDWKGLIWWESHQGRVGMVAPDDSVAYWDPEADGDFPSGPDGQANWIMKGFSIDESGVYVLTNSHLVKFAAAPQAGKATKPAVMWYYTYDRGSGKKTANLQSWGSNTSPTLLGDSKGYVAIMNNADPAVEVNVVDRSTGQLVCHRPMWRNTYAKSGNETSCEMRSATLASFIGYKDAMFMGNYWGFSPLAAVPGAPGYSRVDVVDNGHYGEDAPVCELVWERGTSITSGCLKMSTHSGLVYNTLRRDHLVAPAVCERDPDPRAAKGYDLTGLEYGHNYLEGVDVATGERKYLYDLGAGRFFKGWDFDEVNQVGPAGEFYVGKFDGFKALYDPR